MKNQNVTPKLKVPAELSCTDLLASVGCKCCNTPLVRVVEQELCADCDDKLKSALAKTPWLNEQNARYIAAFLNNSGESVRAYKLVCDASGCSVTIAKYFVREAWREWRRQHPLVAG